MSPFRPAAASVNIATSVTSSAATALTLPSPVPPTFQLRIVNSGTDVVFVRFGNASVTEATSADTPINGGETEVFTLSADQTHVRAIAAANAPVNAPVIRFTAGFGS